MERVQIYVSPTGNDAAAGTREAPLATLTGARNYLRKQNYTGGATVTFLEGVYSFRETVEFTAEDSGNSENPIVYEGEGNVVFSGGAALSYEKLTDVTDPDMLRRIPDPKRVKAIDVSELGLSYQQHLGSQENTSRFYVENHFFETARFPNREKIEGRSGPYMTAKNIYSYDDTVGEKKQSRWDFYYDDEEINARLPVWTEEACEDAVLSGYIWAHWFHSRYNALGANLEKGCLTVGPNRNAGGHSGDNKGVSNRLFISNLPEELDDVGEYYYHRKKGILYFIPYEDFTEDTEMNISVLDESLVKVDGGKNIQFKNIKFRYCIRKGIHLINADSVVFEDCEISHTSDIGAYIEKSNNCKFISCDIFDHGSGCLYFHSCGNRYDLIASGNEVRNCIMYRAAMFWLSYCPAIKCENCCGVLIKGNTISKAHHSHILMIGINDIMIEDNLLEYACMDTDDAGAIYWGRDPSNLGIVLRGNFIRHIGNVEADYALSAVYIDDMATCAEIYNNVFYNAAFISDKKMDQHTNAYALMLNNAQFMKAYNNIVINTYPDQKPCNLFGNPSFVRWIAALYDMEESQANGPWYDWLVKEGFLTPTWKEHYRNTHWAGMWDYVSEEIHQRIEEYRNAYGPENRNRANVDMIWAIYNEAWDHYTEDGEYYPGTFLEYYKERYSKDIKEENLEQFETRIPTDLNAATGNHIFWKLVYHKLFVRSSNIYENNISVGMCRDYLNKDETLMGKVMNGFPKNYNPFTEKLENGESMFTDYGTDFSLTVDGLKEVHKHIPEFHNFSVKNAGAQR